MVRDPPVGAARLGGNRIFRPQKTTLIAYPEIHDPKLGPTRTPTGSLAISPRQASPPPSRRRFLTLPVLVACLGCLVLGIVIGHFVFHPDPITPHRDLARLIRDRIDNGPSAGGYPGHWGVMRPGVAAAGMGTGPTGLELDADQKAEVARLQSIGYAGGSVLPGGSDTGTTIHLRGSAAPNLRFYLSGHAPGAELIEPDGRVRHRWRCSYDDARTAGPADPDDFLVDGEGVTACWRRARLLPDGGVLAIFEGHGLVRLDRASNPLWSYPGACHHDLDVGPDGVIHVLTREARVVPGFHPRKPVLLDFITRLDPDGRELDHLGVLDAFLASPYASYLDNARDAGDIFHTNTLEILDGRFADQLPAFAAGNYLVSVREIGVIAVIDPGQGAVVWALSGLWLGQHQPTLLANGNLLVFDNKGHGGRSKVVELDPATQEVAWEFADSETAPFFSATCGSGQRLANGNTLITESDNGRALEVAPDGAIVWEFRNPERTGPHGEFIAAIMEMVALPEPGAPAWLAADPR